MRRHARRPDLPRMLVPAAALAVLLAFAVPFASAATPVNDDFRVAEDSAPVLSVLTNDTDPDTLTIIGVSEPTHGSKTLSGTPPQITYAPHPDYNGPDSFTYTVRDSAPEPEQATAIVTVTVTEVNDAPVALADSYTVTSAGATFDVRTNDSKGPANESSQTLAAPTLETTPLSGTATVNPNGTITYTPASTFAGNVVFTYKVCDDGTSEIPPSPPAPDPKCATATVAMEVLPALAVADLTVIEGDSGATAATLQVSLNAAFGKAVTVSYATANGSAFSGADYAAASGGLTFAPGELVKSVAVNVVGDPAMEPDETFFLDLSGPVNASIADGRGAATIRNDDSAGCDITGTAGADRLTGTAASETICGLGGNDTIVGGGGDDLISAGPGNDSVDGGSGNDTLTGGAGNDRMSGGPGDDAIDGDAGTDTLSGDAGGDAIEGGSGNDTAFGNAGSDTIDGGGGNDVVRGGGGADTIDGHGGNDRLFGDGDSDRVDGGAGSDRVSGDDGNDWVDGGAGNDGGRPGAAGAGVFGGPGNDTLRGEGGSDVFVGGAGNDTVLGGGGADLVLYAKARGGVSVDLTRGRATGDGRDRISTVENVTGSRFADTLVGNSAANVLAGGPGDDRIFGRAGADTLLGGPGSDVLDGEGGRDTCAVGPGGRSADSC